MNICFIGTDIGPSPDGTFVRGHVNNVIRLSKEFKRTGNNVHIITNMPEFSNSSLYKKWVTYADVSYFPTMFPSLKKNGPEFILKVLHKVLINRNIQNFDIINVHSGFPALVTLSALIKKFTGLTTVHTLYSPFNYAFDDSGLDRLVLSRFTASSFSSVDGIVAVSENVRKSLISRNVSADRITVIPSAISDNFLNPSLDPQDMRALLQISPDAPVVNYMGGFEKSKGLNILMKIINEVVSKIPEVVFIIALNRSTNDPHFKTLKNDLQKKAFSKNIRLVGISDKIADILNIGNVFVAPYLHTMGVADYPLAIFEAMALGKIVVAFNVGGILELLSPDKGIIIPLGNTELFVETVIGLINKKTDAISIGKNASEFVKRYFSVESVAVKSIELFSSLLENKN